MRHQIGLFFTVLLFFFLSSFSFGQSHQLIVEPYSETNPQLLQNVIMGDTTAFGTRNDPDRIYVLRRGGTYYMNAWVVVDRYPVIITAEEGTGPRPKIYNIQNNAGAYGSRIFEVKANTLDLSNLVLSCWFELDPTTLPVMQGSVINISGAGGVLKADNCVFEGGYSNTIVVNAATKYVRLTNSVIANSGNGLRSNLGNGRSIDFRTTSVDSVFIQNCSLLNITDRAVRHYGTGQAPVRNFTFDHNTVFNELGIHGCIGLGMVEGYVKITNNLFVDNFVFGTDTVSITRNSEFADPQEFYPKSSKYLMTLVSTQDTSKLPCSFTIKNNFYSVSSAVQTLWDGAPGGILPIMPLTHFLNKKLGADSTKAFVKLQTPITFTDAPAVAINALQWYLDPARGNRDKATATFKATDDFDRKSLDYFSTTMKLTYAQSSPAYTGDEKGKPVGALNWWGITGVEKTDVVPTSFSLDQNYPNPFNPTTVISYNLPKAAQVSLEVFDVLGRRVATIVNEFQQVGQYKASFDASKLSTGVYVYRLSTPDQSISKKMMLVK